MSPTFAPGTLSLTMGSSITIVDFALVSESALMTTGWGTALDVTLISGSDVSLLNVPNAAREMKILNPMTPTMSVL